jgi:hypothetical protein
MARSEAWQRNEPARNPSRREFLFSPWTWACAVVLIAAVTAGIVFLCTWRPHPVAPPQNDVAAPDQNFNASEQKNSPSPPSVESQNPGGNPIDPDRIAFSSAAAIVGTPLPSDDAEKLSPSMADAVRQAVATGTTYCTKVHGGGFAHTPFQDHVAVGILIGYRVGVDKFFSNDTVGSLQPIYLTPDGVRLGDFHGKPSARVVDLRAKPGYAVGAAFMRGGGGMDAATLMYMRIDDTSLDPTDSYASEKVGGPGGGEFMFDGHGTPIIGICGKSTDDNNWTGAGVIFMHKPEGADQ